MPAPRKKICEVEDEGKLRELCGVNADRADDKRTVEVAIGGDEGKEHRDEQSERHEDRRGRKPPPDAIVVLRDDEHDANPQEGVEQLAAAGSIRAIGGVEKVHR